MSNRGVHLDTAEIFKCRTTTGTGNMIGNEALIIRNFIRSLFPKDFFKDEYIDTQMIQKEMDNEIIFKKKKPCLVIRPKVSVDDDTVFGKLPDWINTNYYTYKRLNGNYMPVFKDDDNHIYMYCSGERIKVSYEIEIYLESKLKQLNTAFYLKGSVLHKSYFYIAEQRMEAEVPKYYIKQIANLMNYDLSDPNERSNFNFYLNEHSQNFLEEKIKLASGNYDHFYLFKTNILSLFESNPEIDDGENQGMTTNNFKISETLTTEFWCPMTYFLEIGQKFKILDPRNYSYLENLSNLEIGLHYTMEFPVPDMWNGYEYHNKIMYITDDDPKRDEVDISELFSDIDKRVIHFADHLKINCSEIFHIDLYLDKYKVENESIVIDWNTYTLTNIRPKINDCYTMVVYLNRPVYNRVKKTMDRLSNREYNK